MWELTKKSWEIARKKFPKIKRLFVGTPAKIAKSGICPIWDLDLGPFPIGNIKYEISFGLDKPVISLSLDDMSGSVSLSKEGKTINCKKIASKTISKNQSIYGKEISSFYSNKNDLAESIAYLAIGSDEGIKGEITKDSIRLWLKDKGFPDICNAVAKNISLLGGKVKTAKKKQTRTYPDKAKVRIVDHTSMQYNENGIIVGFHLRSNGKQKQEWYAVLVDGSSHQNWFRVDQIRISAV